MSKLLAAFCGDYDMPSLEKPNGFLFQGSVVSAATNGHVFVVDFTAPLLPDRFPDNTQACIDQYLNMPMTDHGKFLKADLAKKIAALPSVPCVCGMRGCARKHKSSRPNKALDVNGARIDCAILRKILAVAPAGSGIHVRSIDPTNPVIFQVPGKWLALVMILRRDARTDALWTAVSL